VSTQQTQETELEYTGKAIPGGRHGLTQFIKNFGPDELKALSYGKLSKFIQMSIDKGILKYHKTSLMKNLDRY
jgi:hypothetical protein